MAAARKGAEQSGTVLQAYGDEATTGSWEQAGATFLLLFLYGAAVVPLVYLYSFGFSTPSACQVAASSSGATAWLIHHTLTQPFLVLSRSC